MAAPIWKSYAVRPLGFPGAALFTGWAIPGSSDPADSVLGIGAKVGTVGVATFTDATAATVVLDNEMNGHGFSQDLLAGAAVISWFAELASGWVKGPEITVDLTSNWSSNFDYIKTWAIGTLQKLEADMQPLGSGAKVEIRGSFPRDKMPLPILSVQFSAAPQGERVLGDAMGAPGHTFEEGIAWNATLNLTLWSEFPEERDVLAPWFLRCLQALMALAPFNGIAEPSFSVSESEDFSAALMEKPLFMLSAPLSGIVWSRMVLPSHNYQGHLTV